ncbi:OLC1v1014427C1 [Oldenlandia corymbosa var. corymbosa]|uniref:OLC1v1014427C1 n=1 Tax=Oldenlandia corymbosa var. corymbosa TaxID=529605 RepID=A0AAV1E487_OLDCO|nr:OLC1v1014427C1 [Oldenlandia corymbosa var. corymbosa]
MEKRKDELVREEAEQEHNHIHLDDHPLKGNGFDEMIKDPAEKKKVQLARSIVEHQHSSCKEIDDLTIRRFLRARDLDVEKGASMLLKYLKWRQKFVPNGHFSPSEVPNEIAQNKSFLQGVDKQGRPINVVLGAKHFPNKKQGGLDEFKRFTVFALDKICARMQPGQEKFLVIADLQGWGYANSDIRGSVGSLAILQDFYPERLGKLFLVHVPYVFMTAWKIIYPFIDNETKKKIVFVENKRLKATLLEDIDESQLPEVYGGKLPLVPIHDA